MGKKSKKKHKITEKDDKLCITGILFDTITPSSNGTIISKEAAKKMVEDFNNRIDKGETIWGYGYFEGEPDFLNTAGGPEISDISHLHKKMKIKENENGALEVFGSIELLATPKGKEIKKLIKFEKEHFGELNCTFNTRYSRDELYYIDIIKGAPLPSKANIVKKNDDIKNK